MGNKAKLLGFIFSVLLAVLSGCASTPPGDLIERNDHAGLASWYQDEAVTLRARAEEMRKMAKDYEKRITKPHHRSELVQHCLRLVERYTKAAEEAEALAKLHTEHQMGQ